MSPRRFKAATTFIGFGMVVVCAGLTEAGRGGPWSPPVSEITCEQVLDEVFDGLAVSELDEQTSFDIELLREEEKMARDIYLKMSLLYESPVFSNVARAEQQHMDLVAKLLDRFGLEDPVKEMAIGEFDNHWVQSTYDDLVVAGSRSLLDALGVGATVEDVDIFLLDHMAGHCVDHSFSDVGLIVQNISAGSRNHMRTFVRALLKRDFIYERQFISQDRLGEILNSEMEVAVVLDENGDVIAECGLAGGSRR